MGKIMIIDEKMNSVVIDTNEYTLKTLGIKQDMIQQSNSRRQLNIKLTEFLEK